VSKDALDLTFEDGRKIFKMFTHCIEEAIELDMSKSALVGSLTAFLQFLMLDRRELRELLVQVRKEPLTEAEMNEIKAEVVGKVFNDRKTH